MLQQCRQIRGGTLQNAAGDRQCTGRIRSCQRLLRRLPGISHRHTAQYPADSPDRACIHT